MNVNNRLINQNRLFVFFYFATLLFFSCIAVADEGWLVKKGKTYSKWDLPEHIKQIFVANKPEPLFRYGKKINWYLKSVAELPVGRGVVYGASFSLNADVDELGALVHIVDKKITRVQFGEELHLLSKSSIGAPLNLIKVGDEKFILIDAVLTVSPAHVLSVFSLSGSKLSSLIGGHNGFITVAGYSSDDVVAYGFGLQRPDEWKKLNAVTEKNYKEISEIKRELGIRFIKPFYHREARGFFTAYVIKESGKFEEARSGEWSKLYEDMASKLLKEIKGMEFNTKGNNQIQFLVLFFSVLDGIESNKKILSLYELLPDNLKNSVTSQGVLRYLELYGYSRVSTAFEFGNK